MTKTIEGKWGWKQIKELVGDFETEPMSKESSSDMTILEEEQEYEEDFGQEKIYNEDINVIWETWQFIFMDKIAKMRQDKVRMNNTEKVMD